MTTPPSMLPPSMTPPSVPPAQPPPPPPPRRFSPALLLLAGSGCLCLLLLTCVAGLSMAGIGILPAIISGIGTQTTVASTPFGLGTQTTAAPSTPFAIGTRTTTAPSTPFALGTRATAGAPPLVGPTTRVTPVSGPISRNTPSAGPTTRVTPAGNAPVLTSLRFAPGILEADDSAVDPLDTFPAGTTLIYADFSYSEMRDGTPYRSEWLLNGQIQTDLKSSGTWKDGTAGNWWASLNNGKGIAAGVWQYNFYLNDRLATSGKTTVQPAGSPNFTPIVFAADKDADDKPIDPAPFANPRLTAGLTKLWAFFDGVNVPNGTQFTSQWFLDGQSWTDKKNYTWSLQPNENNYLNVFNTDGSELKPGTYELKLWMGARLVKLGSVIISAP